MSQQENQLIKILFLRKLLRKSQEYNGNQIFGRFGIGVTKYELCSNLKNSCDFFLISTFQEISTIIITYNVSKNTFQKEFEGTQVIKALSFIEQINNNTLIISGISENDKGRFEINYQNKENLLLSMQQERQSHRTNFDNYNFTFIISGQSCQIGHSTDLFMCELFNMKTQNFKEINKILTPISYFGCDQTAYQLYTFGGFQFRTFSACSTIQIYDKTQNI